MLARLPSSGGSSKTCRPWSSVMREARWATSPRLMPSMKLTTAATGGMGSRTGTVCLRDRVSSLAAVTARVILPPGLGRVPERSRGSHERACPVRASADHCAREARGAPGRSALLTVRSPRTAGVERSFLEVVRRSAPSYAIHPTPCATRASLATHAGWDVELDLQHLLGISDS